MTYRTLLKEAEARLGRVVPDEARSDAWFLFASAFSLDRGTYLLKADEEAPEEAQARFQDYLREREARRPVAYILGEWSFFGLDFEVNENVLIPRQDTETLAEAALLEADRRIEEGAPLSVLDLCTGSGCLAVALAHHLEGASVWAADLSPKALEVAARNAERSAVRVHFCQGDLFEALPPELCFHMILSNPPYVSEEEYRELQPEILLHEPRLALVAEHGGLSFYERIIREAPSRLLPGGSLMLEIGDTQAAAVRSLLEEAGFTDIETICDLGRKERVVTARKGPCDV